MRTGYRLNTQLRRIFVLRGFVFIPASLPGPFELQGQIPHFMEKIPAKSSSDPATPSILRINLFIRPAD